MAEKTAAQKQWDSVQSEATRRIAVALEEFNQFAPTFADVFRFVMPQRTPPGTTSTTPQLRTNDDNFTSLGPMMTADFASDIADTFWPEHAQWCGQQASSAVPEAVKDELKEFLKKDTDTIFDAISASNFYEESKRAAKDLSVSAAGVIVQDNGSTEPIHCQVIPLTELLISRGPSGKIDTRVWHQPTLKYADIAALFPEQKIPAKVKAKKDKKGKSGIVIKDQGCYRDYSQPGETAWITFTILDGELIEMARVTGAGSAPILVMRWDPDPCFAWGIGCAINALPDFREHDETRYLMMKGLARQVDPSILYDDDSVMNFDGGMPHGVAIPRMKGSTAEVLESKNRIDTGYFAASDVEHTIRRHYYLDEPEQIGKTPPTLGQWADQSMRRQRRLGTPAAPLWPEFLSEAFQRFRYLLKNRGVVQDFEVQGKGVVQLQPINPLKRAANQDKAVATERFFATINGTFGGNAAALACDVGATIHKIAELADAEGAELKSATEINASFAQQQQQAALQQMAESAGKAGLGPSIGAAVTGQQ